MKEINNFYNKIRIQIRGQVSKQTNTKIWNQIYYQIRVKINDQVWSPVHNALTNNL